MDNRSKSLKLKFGFTHKVIMTNLVVLATTASGIKGRGLVSRCLDVHGFMRSLGKPHFWWYVTGTNNYCSDNPSWWTRINEKKSDGDTNIFYVKDLTKLDSAIVHYKLTREYT